MLGDSAYPCLKQLLVPYKDNGHLTRAQRIYNRRLSSCRVIIENAFGCLKQRFRQLYHCQLRDIVRMVRVIHACCVMHNMASTADLEFFEAPIENEYPDMAAVGQVQVVNEEIDLQREHENGVDVRNEICRRISAEDNL